jgi:hypothetical protein
MIGSMKIDGEKVAEEARKATVGKTSSRVMRTEARKRGLGAVSCGGGSGLAEKKAIAEAETKSVGSVRSDA